ncbi:MAG: hypothetical protein FWC51_00540 [Proteobacteria bacterium]|nr:hypothetical protein [Pseudomonadota bacterium]
MSQKLNTMFYNEFLPQLYYGLSQFYTGIIDPKQPRENWRNEIPAHPVVAEFLINFAKSFGHRYCAGKEISFLEQLYKMIAKHYSVWFEKYYPNRGKEEIIAELRDKMNFWKNCNKSMQKANFIEYKKQQIMISLYISGTFNHRMYW